MYFSYVRISQNADRQSSPKHGQPLRSGELLSTVDHTDSMQNRYVTMPEGKNSVFYFALFYLYSFYITRNIVKSYSFLSFLHSFFSNIAPLIHHCLVAYKGG